ncbi:hypothetical protein E6O75_ATG07745 [Venturia nashicola]|uniref:Uncharacterized protein n=1 Tax=Venturia nashicola TaxID=86259 RepID=A0A4Z1P7D9_9PEZI|nr:hypothetical protein E6O75_ATG07745 [Venturia nashicola]
MSLLVKSNPVTTKPSSPAGRKIWGNGTSTPSNKCGCCQKFGHTENQCWVKSPKLKTTSTKGVGGALLQRITNVKGVSSYSWNEREEMSILCPGAPPKWTPNEWAIRLKNDGAAGFHQGKLIAYPMEPLVRSIYQENPLFKSHNVNIVACGTTLGQLLKYFQYRGRHSAFQIRADLIGETLFLTRPSRSNEEKAKDAQRFGRGYKQLNTTFDKDINNIGTHHRVIEYTLGGLNILLQFEADALHECKVSKPTGGDPVATRSTYLNFDTTTQKRAGAAPPKPAETVQHIKVPQSALLRIETYADHDLTGRKRDKIIAGLLPVLWLRQTPCVAIAWHNNGVFEPSDVKHRDCREDIASWEQGNQEDIRKLILMLKSIISEVKASSSHKMEFFAEASGQLQRKELASESSSILPEHLAERWSRPDSTTNPANSIPAQPMQSFSAPIWPPSAPRSASTEEDLIDLTSEPASDQIDIQSKIDQPTIKNPPATRPETDRQRGWLATSLSSGRSHSPIVPRATTALVNRPAESHVAMRKPARFTPTTSNVIAIGPATKSPIMKISITGIQVAETQAEDTPAIQVLPPDTQEIISSNTPTAYVTPSIKDLPCYNWVAPVSLFGAAYTIAVLGAVYGGIAVAIVCAAIYAGYVLSETAKRSPPAQVRDAETYPPIDLKLSLAPSTPIVRATHIPTVSTPEILDPKDSVGPASGKPIERKKIESELNEDRLPSNNPVKALISPARPSPHGLIFKRYFPDKKN